MKKINVTKSSMPSYEEYCEEIKSIWDTVHLTNMGPLHNKLQDQLEQYLSADNIDLFVNGHLALYCALKALKLKGEIITTPFTFASTVNAIVQAGCTPVFCDVKSDYTIDENKIEALITKNTSAILAVHVYGNVCNVKEIEKIAKKYNLKVVYDSAHAFGVEYEDKTISNYGDVNMFSFHATKVFHTIEGGCLTYKDSSLKTNIQKERNFGINGEKLECFGTNAKMNEFQAAMGICNLKHIDGELELRRRVVERYDTQLKNVKGLKILEFSSKIKRNYAYYPILIDRNEFGYNRNEVCEKLKEFDVISRKYFYPLVSDNAEFGGQRFNVDNARYYSENVLCLPLYSSLELKDVDKICNIIKQMVK